jgi:hypothetical protein
LHAFCKMQVKYFITHIIQVAAEDSWQLGSLLYHHTHTHTHALLAQISFRAIFRETRRHTQTNATFWALLWCGLALATGWTKTAAEFVGLYWLVLAVADLQSCNVCFHRTWPSNQTGGGAILASCSFFDQILHQEESEISVGIFSPTWR